MTITITGHYNNTEQVMHATSKANKEDFQKLKECKKYKYMEDNKYNNGVHETIIVMLQNEDIVQDNTEQII